MKEPKKIEIPIFDWEGSLQDYIHKNSQADRYVIERLRSLGLPSEGHCRLTTTPANVLVQAPLYENFTVKTLAVLLGNQDDFDLGGFKGILHVSGPSVWRIWRIWLMDIIRNDPDEHSIIRYMWDQTLDGARVTIESINNDLAASEELNGHGRATSVVISRLKRLLPGLKIIALEEAKSSGLGRPKGTGWFKNAKDFRAALKAVLATQTSRPTQLHTLKLLDRNQLCQSKPSEPRTQSHTKLLRIWLHRARLRDYDEALRRYWKPSKKRK